MAIVTDLEAVNRDVIDMMTWHYGDRLVKIVLYGSYARGDFHEESDVDYLVLLKDEKVSLSREISSISKYLSRYYLNTFIRISAKPIAEAVFTTSDKLFFNEVRRESKLVYDRKFSSLFTKV